MALAFQVLATGSKGNATVIWTRKTCILLDAGLSGKELVRRLEHTPVKPQQLQAVLLSHEHGDHTCGAGVVSRRFDLPVYLSQGTLEGLPPQIGLLARSQVFAPGTPFNIGDIRIQAFPISHDAQEPTGFILEHEGARLGVCTDLGVVTQLVRVRLRNCHGLILEANHDVQRLLNGPYPPHLKQRIRSRHGHLSNVETRELLQDLHHPELRCVVFAHLSETNNHPDLVRETFEDLRGSSLWSHVRFHVGQQHQVSPTLDLD